MSLSGILGIGKSAENKENMRIFNWLSHSLGGSPYLPRCICITCRIKRVFGPDDFSQAVAARYINVQTHASEPLRIANYTHNTMFRGVWNRDTINCRGLIYHAETGKVVARPWKKFFNFGDPLAPKIGLHEKVVVTDKLDGSLGILCPLPSGGWSIATRGSFHSDQAIHATTLFNDKYRQWSPPKHLTYLFEIIYPENRIVCDYGDLDDLVLLGAVNTTTGEIHGPDELPSWPGPCAEVFKFKSFADALAAPPREGKEGLVVRTQDGRMIKVKQAEYVRLHALILNLSSYSIWNNLMKGHSLEEIIEALPDEAHDWTYKVGSKILNVKERYTLQACSEFENINWVETRKEFAQLASKSNYRPALFNLYDDKSIEELAWKDAKPALITLGQSEDELYALSGSE